MRSAFPRRKWRGDQGFQPQTCAPIRLCSRSCRAVPPDIVSTSSAVGRIGLFDKHQSAVVAHPVTKLVTNAIIRHLRNCILNPFPLPDGIHLLGDLSGALGSLAVGVVRLEGGEKMRLMRNERTHSGLSLQDILFLERFPGVLEVVVVTPSGSTYLAATHEWHAEDNILRKWKQTIMRLSVDLSLLITPGSVEDPELRILADRMPRHYLAQRLFELGAIEYRANQSQEDAIIVASLNETPLRETWLRTLKKEIF